MLFKLSGIGLERVAPAVSGVHRATEVALGLAADRLFEELPKETRRQLKGLPATVKALEDDAQAMREQVGELDAVLAEIGDDDPARADAAERARVRTAVEATRDEAREKLHQAVRALETIRLGLLLLHGGAGPWMASPRIWLRPGRCPARWTTCWPATARWRASSRSAGPRGRSRSPEP